MHGREVPPGDEVPRVAELPRASRQARELPRAVGEHHGQPGQGRARGDDLPRHALDLARLVEDQARDGVARVLQRTA